MTQNYLCKTSDIPPNSSKGFVLSNENEEQVLFIVNTDGNYFAYKNFCPHTGAPLNWQPDIYLDPDNHYIQCSIHGARFELNSGLCVWGPCANQSLIKIKIEVKEGSIYLNEQL